MATIDYRKVFSKLSHIKALSHDDKFDQIVQNIIMLTLNQSLVIKLKNEVAVSNRIDVPGYSTIVTLILFMFGLTILMLGILGEYLMRVLEEVNGRPFSVIASVE